MRFTFDMSYDHDFPVNIGDVFYALDTETRVFKGFCPVCKGETQLTINGITFECPVCRKGSEKICKINHYTVRAYKVTGISLKNNSTTWKTDTNENSYLIELSPHKKRGEYNSYNSLGTRKVLLKELRYEA